MSDSNEKIAPSTVSNEEVIDELTKDLSFSTLDEGVGKYSAFEVNPDDRGDAAFRRAQGSSGQTFKNIDEVDNHHLKKEAKDKDRDGSGSETDSVDDETLRIADESLTDEDRTKRREESESLKNQGNEAFKNKEYERSVDLYTEGLCLCPYSCKTDRAVLYSNRAAAKMKLERNKAAVADCTKAVLYDAKYIKAYYRRAQCHELCNNLDESLSDYQKIVELDPSHVEAQRSVRRLPHLIEERNEKLKKEMMTNLKSLGNMILKPFGLSTDNFQLNQDPESKGYSVNFKQ